MVIVQAALTHPRHGGRSRPQRPRIFMLVFGGGAALAGLAGVIGGPALVTQPNMAGRSARSCSWSSWSVDWARWPAPSSPRLLIGLVQTFAGR
jgi:branched-chain amino acid transport system permease protein